MSDIDAIFDREWPVRSVLFLGPFGAAVRVFEGRLSGSLWRFPRLGYSLFGFLGNAPKSASLECSQQLEVP